MTTSPLHNRYIPQVERRIAENLARDSVIQRKVLDITAVIEAQNRVFTEDSYPPL